LNRVRLGSGWEHLLEIARIEGITSAFTSNPYGGCHGVGCEVRRRGRCWAEWYALKRLKWKSFEPQPRNPLRKFRKWFDRRKPAVITPVSMGDLFGLRLEYTADVMQCVRNCDRHVFALLTKLPQNALVFNPYPRNVWFGVTVNFQPDVWRLALLQKIDASKKYVLFEPLYGPIDYDLSWLDLIVIGPQTKPMLQPKKEWVESILNNASRVHVFMKTTLRPRVRAFTYEPTKERDR